MALIVAALAASLLSNLRLLPGFFVPVVFVPLVTSAIASVPVVVVSLYSKPFWRGARLALLPPIVFGVILQLSMASMGFLRMGYWGLLLSIAATTLFLWVTCLLTSLRIPNRSALRPARPQRCNACGYDLRANVSGTCPECGEAVGTFQPAVSHAGTWRLPLALWGAGVFTGTAVAALTFYAATKIL